MIGVVFRTAPDSLGIEASGHALFDNKGKDLVCCAVATLIQNWRLSVEALCGAKVEYSQSAGKAAGRTVRTHDTELVFASLKLGLEVLAEQYPDHIKIHSEEKNVS